MSKKLYDKLEKCCGNKPKREAFLFDLDLISQSIVKLGRDTNKMKKLVHPDVEYIEDMESSRILALAVFLDRYKDEVAKLMKGLKLEEEDIEEIFEIMP